MSERKNLDALYKFLSAASLKSSNAGYHFEASVNWQSAENGSGTYRVRARTRLSDFNPGRIDFTVADEMEQDGFHLGFNPRFGEWIFDQASGDLSITDRSPQVGHYTARIVAGTDLSGED